MLVDVSTECAIKRPGAEIAAFAADPGNAPTWYVNLKLCDVGWFFVDHGAMHDDGDAQRQHKKSSAAQIDS